MIPGNGDTVAHIKSKLKEALVEEDGHEVTLSIVPVPVVEQETLVRLRLKGRQA